MRILFLNYEYPPLGGGAGNATEALMREFSFVSDLQVDVVTSSVDRKYHCDTLGINKTIRVHRLPIGKNPNNLTYQSAKDLLLYSWRAYWFSRRLLRREKFDGVHAFFTVPCGFLALLLRWEYKLPYIVSLRGSDVPGYSQRFKRLYPFLRALTVLIWHRASAVIANSRGLRDLALQSNPQQSIGVIYNGINTDQFRPMESDLRDEAQFTILCASRLSRRKGFRYAIEAFATLAQRYPSMRLLIAGGEGDAESELKQQVRELHLEDRVAFFGYIPHDDFPRYYNASDVFVFPSLNEGMSNSLLEALACGLPVIATPTGGTDELITEGANGFVVPFQDAAAIAAKLEILLNDQQKARAMGEVSRAKAESMSWRSVAEATRDEYKRYFMQKNEGISRSFHP